jgi:hypothetical protein
MAMADSEGYPPFENCDTGGIVGSRLKKFGLADENFLSTTETELGGNSFKSSGEVEAGSSGFCCGGTDRLAIICAAGGVAGGESEPSVIGEQVEHVWITRGVIGAGAFEGVLPSNSV